MEEPIYAIFIPPKYAGSYKLDKGTRFPMFVKPNIIHRFFTKLLLGWKWEDKK